MVLLETKTGSVKDEITELYKNKKTKHTQINKINKYNLKKFERLINF
jgi:hypothetical protein